MDRRTFLLLSALSPILAKDYIAIDQDIYLINSDHITLRSLSKRLKKLRRYVGFGNFNSISFDTALYYARNYSAIGKFTKKELDLIEKLFFTDPKEFGFYGQRTVKNLGNTISKKDIVKIPYSGHYIFKGKPFEDYQRLIKDVNSDLILTSGVRNVIKQLDLFTNKLLRENGNLTQASKSIAPVGFTHHALKDFDIGKKSWGAKNFTSAFATTAEFAKMRKLKYIDIRYTINNCDGVRYEPWHVKVL